MKRDEMYQRGVMRSSVLLSDSSGSSEMTEVLVVLGSHLTSSEVEKFLFKLCLLPYSEIKERKTRSKASSVSSVIRCHSEGCRLKSLWLLMVSV